MYDLSPKYLWTILLTWCFFYCSCQEKKFDPYDESNYKEVSSGKYQETNLYSIVLQNQVDTQYYLVKVFNDSSYSSDFFIQHFEYKGLWDGPMEGFESGRKSPNKWLYKKGKRHGETVSFRSDSTIESREFYDMGKKVGTWEYYDSHGRVFKKKYYKDDKFVKQEIYNRDGKLARTEYEESTLY